jgi:hypothetical protein
MTATLHAKALTTMANRLREAVREAKLAYQFAPNSYTHAALHRCLGAAKAFDQYIELKGENCEPVIAGSHRRPGRLTPG